MVSVLRGSQKPARFRMGSSSHVQHGWLRAHLHLGCTAHTAHPRLDRRGGSAAAAALLHHVGAALALVDHPVPHLARGVAADHALPGPSTASSSSDSSQLLPSTCSSAFGGRGAQIKLVGCQPHPMREKVYEARVQNTALVHLCLAQAWQDYWITGKTLGQKNRF